MRRICFIVSISCLAFLTAHGQYSNVLASYRSDSLFSSATQSAETSHDYVFAINYQKDTLVQLEIPHEQFPSHSVALVVIDKQNGQQTVRYHQKHNDTSWVIYHLYSVADTIRTIEIAAYTDSACHCKAYTVWSNRYDEHLNLIKSRLLDSLNESFYQYFGGADLVQHNTEVVFMPFYRYLNIPFGLFTRSAYLLYSIYRISDDSAIVKDKRLNPVHNDTLVGENLLYTSVSDSGDFFLPGEGFDSCNLTCGLCCRHELSFKLHTKGTYWWENFLPAEGYEDTPKVRMVESGYSYYLTQHRSHQYQALNVLEHTDLDHANKEFMGAAVIKSHLDFQVQIPPYGMLYGIGDAGYCSADTTQQFSNPEGISGTRPIVFINDNTILCVHPTNTGIAGPWGSQVMKEAVEYLDTDLNLKQRTLIYSPTDNFYVEQFNVARNGNLIIYGYKVPRGTSRDSIRAFAFILDHTTGQLLDVANAGSPHVVNSVSVYPNPFSRSLTINKSTTGTAHFYLYDGVGRLVLSAEITAQEQVIAHVPGAPGLYYYRATGKEGELLSEGKLLRE